MLLAAVLLFAAPLEPAHSAAHKLCSGYTECRHAGYSDHGYGHARHSSYWDMGTGSNCTNFVAYRLVREGMPNRRPHPDHGARADSLNAYRWGVVYAGHTDHRPRTGAVAWWSRSRAGYYGHVAYVEAVNRDGTLTISEDSATGHGFDWKRISPGGRAWPSGFIHFTLPGQRARPVHPHHEQRPQHRHAGRAEHHHQSRPARRAHPSESSGGTIIIAPLEPAGTTIPAGPGHVTVPAQPRTRPR
ncbi:MAG TPA: CHAP domain-containing protein [Sporichthyaceae bacterium]